MISFPNAKINIGLNIVEKRSDGFHNIETVFYPINLCDILEFIVGQKDDRIAMTGLQVDGHIDNNLVIKAYNLLKNKFPIPQLSFHLHKITPMGAGLGGGSSDAAFTIKSINNYFNLRIPKNEMEYLAAELGSDCAFFIRNRPVFAYEKGNKFNEIEPGISAYSILLVHPAININTAEAYKMINPLKPEKSLTDLINQPITLWKDLVKNDFEDTVFKKHPLIKEIKEEMYKLGAVYASMSGSGSAIYGIFESLPHVPSKFEKYFIWKGNLRYNSLHNV